MEQRFPGMTMIVHESNDHWLSSLLEEVVPLVPREAFAEGTRIARIVQNENSLHPDKDKKMMIESIVDDLIKCEGVIANMEARARDRAKGIPHEEPASFPLLVSVLEYIYCWRKRLVDAKFCHFAHS